MIYPECGSWFARSRKHKYDEIKFGKAVCRYCKDEVDFRIVKTVYIASTIELETAKFDLRKEIEGKLLADTLDYFENRDMFDDTISIYERESTLGVEFVAEAYSI